MKHRVKFPAGEKRLEIFCSVYKIWHTHKHTSNQSWNRNIIIKESVNYYIVSIVNNNIMILRSVAIDIIFLRYDKCVIIITTVRYDILYSRSVGGSRIIYFYYFESRAASDLKLLSIISTTIL